MNTVRRQLRWKLFLSYLVVIVVSAISLALAAEIYTPSALARHMDIMTEPARNMTGMMNDLTAQLNQAVHEILLVAAAVALAAAIAVSGFVTRRIVAPIQAMRRASQRIAGGEYNERVQVISDDELGDLGRSFNLMAAALQQTEEQRRMLIGDVAHELRTPLTTIRSVLEGIVDGVLPNTPETFVDIQREVQRLQRLVHDLEELSRAEAGQLSLELVPTHPHIFVQAAVDRLTWQFEDKGVVLHVNVSTNLPLVQVDTQRMMQVMINLLGNALQYTEAGGDVWVSAENSPTALRIHVRDTGIGLTRDQLHNIFERFYRVDKSRSRAGGGSGIGLTISKHLVEAHGGTLTAASPGLQQGSLFTVTLPI